MVTTPSGLDDEPRSALASFIRQLEGEFYRWYDKASGRAYYAWLIMWWVAVAAGFLTTILGILVQNGILEGPYVKSVILILPALGSLAAVLLAHFTERKALRERGRQAMQRIAAEARSAYASLGSNDAALTALHNEIIERVARVEEEQLKGFLRTAQQGAIGQSTSSASPP